MYQAELDRIVKSHGEWLDSGGKSGKRASLDGASLDGARLVGASLDGARLVGASLDGASLVRARLVGARLDGASLVGASLDGARLVGASLDGASLVGASLDGARLVGARLDGASLVGARLDGAAGCVVLTDTHHGYRVVAGQVDGAVRIWAGCRSFSLAEARAHWGATDYHTPSSGRRILATLDWLETEMAANGGSIPK